MRRERTAGRHMARLLFELLLLALAVWGAVTLARYGFDRYYHGAYPMKYTGLIDAACAEKGLDRALVYAVVRTESGFDPDAESNVGARGLMQLMPDAFAWVQMRKGGGEPPRGERCFDPAVNVEYGASMLRILLDEFGTVDNVLCAYHAGWGSAKRWLADPERAPDGEHITSIPFDDTRAYVAKVKKTMEIYRRLYGL